jgi:hypothetical protein
MFNLFRRTAARPAPAPKAQLSLQSLDRRDCPSGVGGDDWDWCGSSPRFPIPPRPDRLAVAIIGSVVQPVAPDFGGLVDVGTPMAR